MVFSWGHRTQRRIYWHKRGRNVLHPAVMQEEEWWRSHFRNRVRTLSTASGVAVRWPAFSFPIADCRLPIRKSKSLDQGQSIHVKTQRFRDHYRAVGLLVILE